MTVRISELGGQLREVRELRGLSLKRAADPAGISTAYLQKLERGEVRSPSPHVLYGLSQALDVPYEGLMRLAGYVVPKTTEASDDEETNLLAHALDSEDLSEEELKILASYLRWYRHDKEGRRS